MAINYSLSARPSIPADKNSEKKVYPYAQYREIVTLNDLSKHIASHGSPYTRDVILGVITAAVDCIEELLLQGCKVQLGEMGAFYVTVKSVGVDKVEDFNPAVHIKDVSVRWERGQNFKNLIKEATFNYATTRHQQAEARKQEKEAVKAELEKNTSENAGNGGSDGNGDSGDPGDITG